jgi:hypothetical protein
MRFASSDRTVNSETLSFARALHIFMSALRQRIVYVSFYLLVLGVVKDRVALLSNTVHACDGWLVEQVRKH